MDIFDESSSLSNFVSSSYQILGNDFLVYGALFIFILIVVSYLVYKYYFNKNNSIGSTHIDYLGTDDSNQNNETNQSNKEHYVDNNDN
jgi:hypothetical protein